MPFAADIQRSFGEHDISHIEAYSDASAMAGTKAMGAGAFASGNKIVLGDKQDKHTVAHEVAHVMQQRAGVQLLGGVGAAGDDYERNADAIADRVVAGQSAVDLLPAKDQTATPVHSPGAVQRKELETTVGAEHSTKPAATIAFGIDDEVSALSSPVQRDNGGGRTPVSQAFVRYWITVSDALSPDAFKQRAMKQIFGGPIKNAKWTLHHATFVAGRYPVDVDGELLRANRAEANSQRGIVVDSDGVVDGAPGRAKAFENGPTSPDKQATLTEIDRRFHSATGQAASPQASPAEQAGQAQLRDAIRDEVLYQQAYIQNLPDGVKQLIRARTGGRPIKLAELEKLFALAKRIEAMPPAQVADYTSKVSATTGDLDAFAKSLDRYSARAAARTSAEAELDQTKTKLADAPGQHLLKDLYAKYQTYNLLLTTPQGSIGFDKVRDSLNADLKANGFASISEFERYIKRFETQFERGAANIVVDMLQKAQGRLFRELERYQNPAEIQALHQQLGGFREHEEAFSKGNQQWAKVSAQEQKANERSRLPGNGGTAQQNPERLALEQQIKATKAAAVADIETLAPAHPIFQEGDLPLDKRINKEALGRANEANLGRLLTRHLHARIKDLQGAQAQIEDKPELIYKLNKLMPLFYQQQGLDAESVFADIIQAKMRSDLIAKIAIGIVAAIVAVGLAIVSMGTAVPAMVAGGAAVAGAGLSGYMAYSEYKEYTENKGLAAAGLVDDPSVAWLVIAVVGAAVDLGAAANAMKALSPAAKALQAGGETSAFAKAVQQLEAAGELEAKVARAAERAATARQGFRDAGADLVSAVSGKMYSGPAFLDPQAFKALVKMARNGMGTVFHSVDGYLAEVKLARTAAKLGELTPAELLKAKEAWEVAKAERKAAAKLDEVLEGIAERTAKGKVNKTTNYHPHFDDAKVLEILKSPDAIYQSEGNAGRLIYRKGENIVVVEGAGSGGGRVITGYGPAGNKGASGAVALGGKASDAGQPITHEMIIEGRIPKSNGEFLPKAEQIR